MTALIDLKMLREITGGDLELEQGLFSLYWATTERCLAKLESLTVADDENQWHSVTHELKGASANMRAEAMTTRRSRLGVFCREVIASCSRSFCSEVSAMRS